MKVYNIPNPIPFLIILFGILIFGMCSCNIVKKSTSDRATLLYADTIRVTTYDTSKQVIETMDFQNKTIEVYDTVHITKDSIIYVIKTRTIWENGNKRKQLIQQGTGKDSVRIITQYKEVIKWKEKESKRFPIWLIIAGMVLIALIIFLYKFKV